MIETESKKPSSRAQIATNLGAGLSGATLSPFFGWIFTAKLSMPADVALATSIFASGLATPILFAGSNRLLSWLSKPNASRAGRPLQYRPTPKPPQPPAAA